MEESSSTFKRLGKMKGNSKLLLPIIAISIVVGAYLFTRDSDIVPLTQESKLTSHPTLDDIRQAYDPKLNADRIKALMKTPCNVSMPTREQATKNKYRWNVSRFVSYHNIVPFLESYFNDPNRKYKAHDFGASRFLRPFEDKLDLTRSGYPEVDIHHTPYEDNTFDIVGADQVIEHIQFPHAAILELKRILKPGGLMILTTCAYNPYHGAGPYGDYWRFLQQGLKLLSLPMDGGIKVCGSWGSKEAISMRAKHGLLSSAEKAEHGEKFVDLVTKNDEEDPFTSWIVMQK